MRSPGVLFFFKDRAAASGEESRDTSASNDREKEKDKNKDSIAGELTSIKLKLAVTIEVVQKTGKDSSVHLLIELSDETLDLRVQAQEERTALEEAERWKALLLLWKDYSVDYGEGDRQGESGGVCLCAVSSCLLYQHTHSLRSVRCNAHSSAAASSRPSQLQCTPRQRCLQWRWATVTMTALTT